MQAIFRLTVVGLVLLMPSIIVAQENRDSVVVEFGMALQDSINNANYDYVKSVLDEEYFADKYIYKDSTNLSVGLFNYSFKNVMGLVLENVFRQFQEKEASYNIINYYEETEGAYFLRFRLFSTEGFNYHDYEIVFDEDGNPRVGDLFIYLTGEYLSETIKTPYYSGLSEFVEDEEIAQYAGQFKHVLKLKAIRDLKNEGNFDEAKNLYESIPEEIREQRVFMILGVQLYSEVDDPEKYEAIIKRYISMYPNNACLYLLSIDMYIVRGEFDKSLAMVDSLIEVTDDDLLPYVKGNIYYEMEDYINAENMYEYIAENYPSMDDNWIQLMDLDIHLQKYGLAIRCLDRLITDCGYERKDLSEHIKSEYPSFSKQEEFLNWQKL